MLVIKEIHTGKKRFLNLLLIGDEQEDMIDRYLERCRLFIGYRRDIPAGCCAVTFEPDNIIEIKNLAVLPDHRRNGIGRSLLRHIETTFPGTTIQLGTGETPSTLQFYRNCGFVYSHRIPNFFPDNYNHAIIEEGVQLKDMIYLTKRSQPLTVNI